MELADKVVVVTGGASGIGKALCRRFVDERAKAVVVADVNGADATAVADDLGPLATPISADVAREADVVSLVTHTEERFGPIDLFCSNAGVGGGGGIEATDED